MTELIEFRCIPILSYQTGVIPTTSALVMVHKNCTVGVRFSVKAIAFFSRLPALAIQSEANKIIGPIDIRTGDIVADKLVETLKLLGYTENKSEFIDD